MTDKPSRFVGFRLNKARRSDCASELRNWGMPSFALWQDTQTHTPWCMEPWNPWHIFFTTHPWCHEFTVCHGFATLSNKVVHMLVLYSYTQTHITCKSTSEVANSVHNTNSCHCARTSQKKVNNPFWTQFRPENAWSHGLAVCYGFATFLRTKFIGSLVPKPCISLMTTGQWSSVPPQPPSFLTYDSHDVRTTDIQVKIGLRRKSCEVSNYNWLENHRHCVLSILSLKRQRPSQHLKLKSPHHMHTTA